MQGSYQFNSQTFVCINMDALIPAQHLLRKIDQHVDFSFIKALTAKKYCSDNGRPSIVPSQRVSQRQKDYDGWHFN